MIRYYRVELRDETNADLDAGLLGLPAESDWTLHGPYPDKSLIRNALIYDLGRQLGMEAPRTRHFELFLNLDGGDLRSADYMGVYVLIEKIKQGKNRTDITEMTATDNTAPEVTDGSDPRLAGGGISPAAIAISSGGTVTVNATTSLFVRTYHTTWTTTPSNGDGITTLMEFALGLDPNLHDAPAVLPTCGMVGLAGDDYMTLSFRRLKLGCDVTYRAMVSPDLHDWTEVTTEVGTPVDNSDGTETVTMRDLLQTRDATRRFMRLEVER